MLLLLVLVVCMLGMVGGCCLGMRRVKLCCGSCGGFLSRWGLQGRCSSWQSLGSSSRAGGLMSEAGPKKATVRISCL
jgi:hypothetical protein